MAKSKENLYLFGLSGSVGKQMVFRNTARGTILAKSPRHTHKRTDHQKEQGKKFLKAVAYAKQALADSSLSTKNWLPPRLTSYRLTTSPLPIISVRPLSSILILPPTKAQLRAKKYLSPLPTM